MEAIVGWLAPIATILAACVTAANLGSRITGWGFVIFTIGSIAWTTYGVITGQPNLLWQNVALTVVNLVGVWRWLGRRARFDEGAKSAAHKSQVRPGPPMFPVSRLASMPVTRKDGGRIGTTVDAMASCDTGRINYIVISDGGVASVGESLYALPWDRVSADSEGITVDLGQEAVNQLMPLKPDDWPGVLRGSRH